MKAYRDSIGRGQEEFFDKIYGHKQLSLAQVATHPDYFRRGAGTMLIKWGLDLAEKETWAVTVFAGPKAYRVYERLGFKTLGTARAQVDGEEEFIEFPGMAWEPSNWPKKA
jgi:predicted N-acetyltransferase YhbS